MSKLTVKQEAFCLHYAKTGNATESYKQAGYKVTSDSVTAVNACRLLKNDNIKHRLAEIAKETKTAAIADISEIQERLTAILRNEVKEQVVVVENCGDFTSEARLIEKDASIKDRINAGVNLAKMQGGFDNKFQLEMTIPQFGGESDLED